VIVEINLIHPPGLVKLNNTQTKDKKLIRPPTNEKALNNLFAKEIKPSKVTLVMPNAAINEEGSLINVSNSLRVI
jgi:hypothetical protein